MFQSEKTVLLTGASEGLGRELAIELSLGKYRLIIASRNENRLKETQSLCQSDPGQCETFPLDLTQLTDENLKDLVTLVETKYGKIDYLIHNASLSQRSLAVMTEDEVERKIMETIFFGPIKLTKTLLPLLEKSEEPNIVLISSLAGKFGVPLRSTYSAAKHALHGYFEAMRLELPPKFKVSFFVLGGVKTDSAKNALSADGQQHNQHDVWHHRNMSAKKCAHILSQKLPLKKK